MRSQNVKRRRRVDWTRAFGPAAASRDAPPSGWLGRDLGFENEGSRTRRRRTGGRMGEVTPIFLHRGKVVVVMTDVG